MPTGSVQTIVVCVPSAFHQSPCPAGQAIGTIQGYVLDPSQQAAFESSTAPFDYLYAAGIWSFSFSFILGLYLFSKSIGTVLDRIRR